MGTKHTEQLYQLFRDPTRVPMFIVNEQTLENLALLDKCKNLIEIADALCDDTILALDHQLILAESFQRGVNSLLSVSYDRNKVASVMNYAHGCLDLGLRFAIENELYEIAQNIKMFNELLDRGGKKK